MTLELRPLIRFVSKKRFTTTTASRPQHFVSAQANSGIVDDVDHDDLEPSITSVITTSVNPIKDWINRQHDIGKIRETNPEPLGFFDSIFTSEKTDGTNVKVEAIILWIVTYLCLIMALGWLFKLKKTNSRLILIHILLYEFCYLLYILLSMINVALGLHLNSVLCDFANYGMYLSIPMMHFNLIFLSIQRLNEHVKMSTTWTKICSNAIITQIILLSFWLIFIASASTWFVFRVNLWKKIAESSIEVLPPAFGEEASKFFALKSDGCSIDGRILPPFKILLFILLIVLIVLLIKSLITTMAFGVFTEMIRSRNKRKSKKEANNNKYRSTITFFAIILCNLFFSYPFYFISIFSFVFNHFESTRDTYTTTLQMSFLFRIISILLQSIAVLLIEENVITSIIRCIRARNPKESIPAKTRVVSRRTRQSIDRLKPSDELKSEPLGTVPDERPEQNKRIVTRPLINGKLSTESQQIYAAISEQCPIRATKSLPLPKRTSSISSQSSSSSESSASESSSSESSAATSASEESPKSLVTEAKPVRNHRRPHTHRPSTRRLARSPVLVRQDATSDSDIVASGQE